MFGKILDVAVDVVTQPISDAVDVLDGLSEGELRSRAIARLGADVVASLTLEEIIDLLKE